MRTTCKVKGSTNVVVTTVDGTSKLFHSLTAHTPSIHPSHSSFSLHPHNTMQWEWKSLNVGWLVVVHIIRFIIFLLHLYFLLIFSLIHFELLSSFLFLPSLQKKKKNVKKTSRKRLSWLFRRVRHSWSFFLLFRFWSSKKKEPGKKVTLL